LENFLKINTIDDNPI